MLTTGTPVSGSIWPAIASVTIDGQQNAGVGLHEEREVRVDLREVPNLQEVVE